ncbi:NAD(P)/FAD-dependent oxidoreductase [Chryseobacterium sp. 1B4]
MMVQQLKSKRIAVIGAGLGGLCLAQGLKKNGIPCTVFEKDAAINARSQGYRIRVNEPGRKALEECLPGNLYRLFLATCAASYSGMKVLTTTLERSQNPLVESWSDGVKEMPDLKPNRLTLREILLQGIQDNICFGKELTDWQETESGEVELTFSDSSTYTADLVVAADGVHSGIGKEYCRDRKINTGNITIYGRTFYSEEARHAIAEELQEGTSVIIGDRFSLITDFMSFDFSGKEPAWDLLSPFSDYFYWAFIGNPQAFGMVKSDFYSHSAEEILNAVHKVTHQWHPQLKALFQHADRSSLSVTPIRSSLPKEPWKSGNITALGDAVHTMSPAGGVGANTAFTDASLLTSYLTGKNSIPEAVADYEKQMVMYSNQAIEMSLEGGEILHGINDNDRNNRPL